MPSFQYYFHKLCKRIQGKAIRGCKIDRNAYVNSGCNIVNTNMGAYSYCGYDCWIIEANIGKFCSISNQVHIGGPSHPFSWVSTSPIFHDGRNVFNKNFSNNDYIPFERTEIGNDVWIGENAYIKAGVKIGDGSIIGMGSVVTKDVASYEIWAGNPARKIRDRFEKEKADLLIKYQWWNWDESLILKRADLFNDLDLFIKEVQEG